MKLRPKLIAFAGFASRIVSVSKPVIEALPNNCYSVVITTICRLAYLNTALTKTDPIYGLWRVVVCTQAQTSLGIITACVPYLKPFLAGLSSGILRNDDIRRRAGRGKSYEAVPGTGIYAFFEKDRDHKKSGERGPPVPPKDLLPPPGGKPRLHRETVRSENSRLDDGDFLDTISSVTGPSPGMESLDSYRSDYIILPHERNAFQDSVEMESL